MNQIKSCLLPNRRLLILSGQDRTNFLQSLVSNDVTKCDDNSAVYAALLTPQGKFLYDLFVINKQDHFLIDCEASRAEDLLNKLKSYKLRSKISLDFSTAELRVRALWGASISPSKELYLDPRLSTLGARIVADHNETSLYPEHQFEEYDQLRLSLGVPDGSRDMILEQSTLLECNLDKLNAISWTKGCYLGQELTARMHYRGLTKNRLFPVLLDGPHLELRAPIYFGNNIVGDMRSSQGNIGLALLNVERATTAIKTGDVYRSHTTSIKPYQPTWWLNS